MLTAIWSLWIHSINRDKIHHFCHQQHIFIRSLQGRDSWSLPPLHVYGTYCLQSLIWHLHYYWFIFYYFSRTHVIYQLSNKLLERAVIFLVQSLTTWRLWNEIHSVLVRMYQLYAHTAPRWRVEWKEHHRLKLVISFLTLIAEKGVPFPGKENTETKQRIYQQRERGWARQKLAIPAIAAGDDDTMMS